MAPICVLTETEEQGLGVAARLQLCLDERRHSELSISVDGPPLDADTGMVLVVVGSLQLDGFAAQ